MSKTSSSRTKLSRILSYALRHQPQVFGLTLDADGWVALDELLSALNQHQAKERTYTRSDVESVLSDIAKQRFEILDGSIRALYGHSLERKIELSPSTPPPYLYHGTTPTALKPIVANGLISMRRQYVHLSPDVQTAREVALRRTSSPVILTVLSNKAVREGVNFYSRIDQVWLSDSIDPKFIKLPTNLDADLSYMP